MEVQHVVVKEYWKSKTFWWNVAVVLIACYLVFENGFGLDVGKLTTVGLGASGAYNLYLRFVTKQPITMPRIPGFGR